MVTSVTGAGGVLLYYSGATSHGVVGNASAQTLTGGSGNDSFRGGGGGDTLIGLGGDDTYAIYSKNDMIVEQTAGGVDSADASTSYLLPANVENLVLYNNLTYGGGNALNNILTGMSGNQTLDGGGGSDVLIGGLGADIFVLKSGDGHDVVADFQSGIDQVRLDGLGVTSFAQAQSDMVQTGADVTLSVPTGEQFIFRNHQVSDFSGQDFQLSVDTSKMTLTFDDEFNSRSLKNGTIGTGTWDTAFGSGSGLTAHSLTRNGELQVYMYPTFAGTGTTALGVDPFSVNGGVLNISASLATPSVANNIWNYQYTSGLISTRSSFAQTYGYFEVRAKLPAGDGMWPAFWMVPASGAWPPELDIFEQLGHDTNTLYATKHSGVGGTNVWHTDTLWVPDTSAAFHTYGLYWDQTNLIWYVDGTEVDRMATPSDANQPMYMMLNLAIGGWSGAPDPNAFPGTMSIDYVRAYRFGR